MVQDDPETARDRAEAERRAFIRQVRRENDEDFGPAARDAVKTLLRAGHPIPWAYVYELTQNAADAGARRISWRIDGESLLFQHDGDTPLDQSHVRGLASLGASTKGSDAIGFMGVGFKSVFERFRTARIAGFGWRFKFDITTTDAEYGAKIVNWFDALRPWWDPEPLTPTAGYTTAFSLDDPVVPLARLAEDLAYLASPEDLTPLATLALRGLEEVCIDDVTWHLTVQAGVVEVCRAHDPLSRRWRFFESRYRPDDEAMRRFVEVRQRLTTHAADGTRRPERNAVALVPLGEDWLPDPPNQGRVYATLPTGVQAPFGFHLQADWLVNLDRQNLRAVAGNPWQEAIVRQVPKLVREVLLWLREESDDARRKGYKILCDPTDTDGEFSDALSDLRRDFIRSLEDLKIVPTLGPATRRFSTPKGVIRLPGRFLTEFGKRPEWRPDLLFERDLMDERLLGNRAVQFADWLGWGRDVDPDDVSWTVTLPNWWSSVPSDERIDALFALWSCVDDREWHDAPVVPTEAGGWLRASETLWLNERLPSDREPSGAAVRSALAPLLPAAERRVPQKIRARVERTYHAGVDWLEAEHCEQDLADIVEQACADADLGSDFPLVELLEWALARGAHRQDLVPMVLTENGPHHPSSALLADPLVPGGDARRLLFPDMPALVEDYAIIDDQHAVVDFLRRLGVRGDATLEKHQDRVGYNRWAVARQLGLEDDELQPANASGWTVFDYSFPFAVQAVSFDALQRWLSREHALLVHKGRRRAVSKYHYDRTTTGERPSAWVRALEEHPWILCQDGQRRRPGDILLDPDLDFEDAPVAEIDHDLAERLEQEGVRFGVNISRSPVLRRLEVRGPFDLPDDELAELLEEARAEVEAGAVTREDLTAALRCVMLRGVPVLDRLVRDVGPRTRSNLGGWVVALSSLEHDLVAALEGLEIAVPETTTGQQAFGYLSEVWKQMPDSVDAIRPHIASAYQYVLEDIKSGHLDGGVWRDARGEVRLYGKRRWHEISDTLVVDDVQSPFIHQLLPDSGIAITSTHLGDNRAQIRRVADELGIALLSTEIELREGRRAAEPTWMVNLKRLVAALATLEGRSTLDGITLRENLELSIQGERRPVNAYLDDGELMVVGSPATFSAEAAGQLVEHFRLAQRGNSIPWLTGALFSLAEEPSFSENLRVLASGLGLSLPEMPSESSEEDVSEEEDPSEAPREEAGEGDVSADTDHTPASQNEIAHGPGIEAAKDGDGEEETATGEVSETSESSSKRPAADHFGILVSRGRSQEPAERPPTSEPVKRKDDHKARLAVVEYEEHHGRQATESAEHQPGFDVLSRDRVTGRQRRIEVKGVQRDFVPGSSVVLTARQVTDALYHGEDDMEYWLYVVDRTETENPRVFPIPWTRYPTRLRYGFQAEAWARFVEHSEVTED